MEIKLNIDEIPNKLYNDLLEEMIEQFGKGYYTDWEIKAIRGKI